MRRLFNFFIANAGNNHSPTLLQRAALVGMACLVVLSFIMSSLQTVLWQYSDWLVGNILPAVVTDLTNTERRSYSAPTLVRNTLLDEAARLKAEHMAAEGYFSHYSPGGISPWFWFERVGYTYAHAGENLAVHFFDSTAVVEAWMKSPTHKANIVNDKYTEIGIGVAKGRYEGFDTVFVVQLFGTPAQSPVLDVTPLALDVIPVREVEVITDTLAAAVPVTTVEELVAGVEDYETMREVTETVIELNSVAQTELSEIDSLDTLTLEEQYGHYEGTSLGEIEKARIVLAQTDSKQFLSISTTSGLIPVPINNQLLSAGTSAPMLAQLATQPNTWLRYIYLGVGSLVIFSLLASVVIGWRRHRPLEIAYGAALLSAMVGFYYLHTALTSGAVIM